MEQFFNPTRWNMQQQKMKGATKLYTTFHSLFNRVNFITSNRNPNLLWMFESLAHLSRPKAEKRITCDSCYTSLHSIVTGTLIRSAALYAKYAPVSRRKECRFWTLLSQDNKLSRLRAVQNLTKLYMKICYTPIPHPPLNFWFEQSACAARAALQTG